MDDQMSEQAKSAPRHYPDGTVACSIKKFADMSGFGRSTIYEAIKRGDLKARKYKKRSTIHAEDGLAFLENLPAA
jgi:predicted DNA-binding transcriptional regulator AlpA